MTSASKPVPAASEQEWDPGRCGYWFSVSWRQSPAESNTSNVLSSASLTSYDNDPGRAWLGDGDGDGDGDLSPWSEECAAAVGVEGSSVARVASPGLAMRVVHVRADCGAHSAQQWRRTSDSLT
jgi:hypothetical protein